MKGDKWINASALIRTLSVDPVACMGCPEPEFLPEMIALFDEIDEFFYEDVPETQIKHA